MKLLLLGPIQSSFVKNDINLLDKHYEVKALNSSFGRGLTGLRNLFKLTFFSIFHLLKSDVLYCWFADYATFLPSLLGRLLGKKVYVVAGGFDARHIKEINYGAKARPLRWFCVRNTFRLATKIFPVSNFTAESLHEITNGKHAPLKVVYNAPDLDKFISLPIPNKRKNQVITISQADTELESHLKGISRFINTAILLPEIQFIVGGLRAAALTKAQREAEGINNVSVLEGPLDLYSELVPLFCESAAYLQLSTDETFGLAVVEAMACGCVPIVTNIGGLPEIVPGEEFIINNDAELINMVRRSQSFSRQQREKFIQHAQNFNLKKRGLELFKEMNLE